MIDREIKVIIKKKFYWKPYAEKKERRRLGLETQNGHDLSVVW